MMKIWLSIMMPIGKQLIPGLCCILICSWPLGGVEVFQGGMKALSLAKEGCDCS